MDGSVGKSDLSQSHILSAFRSGYYSKIEKKIIFTKKTVMVILKSLLNQCRLVEVSFLFNVNF